MRQSVEERKKELIRKVKSFIEKKHYFPKKDELEKIGCSEGKIRKYFGTLYDFEQLIGLTHNKRKFSKGIVTNEMIIAEINTLYNKLGYPPHPADYPRYATAKNRFGGNWHKVLKACHIKATFENGAKNHSKEELIFKGKKEIEKYGRMPKWRELHKDKFPIAQISVYWGTLYKFADELNTLTVRDKKYFQEKELYSKAIKTLLKDNQEVTFRSVCKLTGKTSNQFTEFLRKQARKGDLENSKLETFILANGGNKAVLANKKKITVRGITYNSINDAAQAMHISPTVLKSRINLLGSDSPWLNYKGTISRKSIIKINHKVYPSLPAAAKANNISLATLRSRLYRYGNNYDKLFSKEHIYPKTPKAFVIINNVKYQDITSASRSLNISSITLQHRLRIYGNNDPRIVKQTERK